MKNEPPPRKAAGWVRPFPSKPENRDELESWVHEIYDYVEGEALDAIDWYGRHTRKKKKGSLLFRYLAIILGGLAGLLPILLAVVPQRIRDASPIASEQASLFVSLLIGLAALLVALDRLGDFSSGWMRYMLTAFNIRKELQEFRLDWIRHYSELPHPADFKDLLAGVDRAKQFVLKVESYVGDETRQWATEFQQNLSQMETEITKKWEEREKKIEEQIGFVKTGAVQLTVTNAKDSDNRKFTVKLNPGDIEEEVIGSQTWVKAGLPQGMYTVSALGTFGGKPAADSKVASIRPGEVTALEVTLLQ